MIIHIAKCAAKDALHTYVHSTHANKRMNTKTNAQIHTYTYTYTNYIYVCARSLRIVVLSRVDLFVSNTKKTQEIKAYIIKTNRKYSYTKLHFL